MPAPTPLHDRADEQLAFIRDTMARASSFTAVPGWGGVLMGLTALIAAATAGSPLEGRWLVWWLATAVVAASIGTLTMARKANRVGTPLGGAAARRFAWALIPALVAGAILTGVFFRAGLMTSLPGCWLLLYGTAIASGGAFSIRLVPLMGMLLMALGAAAFIAPASWGNLFMAVGFGGLHIAFGLVIARRYGG